MAKQHRVRANYNLESYASNILRLTFERLEPLERFEHIQHYAEIVLRLEFC